MAVISITNVFSNGTIADGEQVNTNNTDITTQVNGNINNANFANDPVFDGDLTVDTNTLFVDSAANRVGINTITPAGSFHVIGEQVIGSASATVSTLDMSSSSASYTGDVLDIGSSTASGSGFDLIEASSSGDLEFRVRGDGEVTADGSFTGGGADYAEYFEWADGNPSNEDRRGYSVVLENGKIRKATDTDDKKLILGGISARPSFVGDNPAFGWKNKYLRDDFGQYILEDYTVTRWVEEEKLVTHKQVLGPDKKVRSIPKIKIVKKNIGYPSDSIPDGVVIPDDAEVITHDDKGKKLQRRKINPDFDPSATYIPRDQRNEWDTVGLLGKIPLRKGQPTGDRWIKLQDTSDTIERWMVR